MPHRKLVVQAALLLEDTRAKLQWQNLVRFNPTW